MEVLVLVRDNKMERFLKRGSIIGAVIDLNTR